MGFQVGAYDPRYRLVIDPVLTFSTVFGGYGSTTHQLDRRGFGRERLLCRVYGCHRLPYPQRAAKLEQWKQRSFCRKGGAERKADLCHIPRRLRGRLCDRYRVDWSGSAIVAGWTTSRNFAVTASFQGSLAGGRDALWRDSVRWENRLLFSTYFGGAANDTANGVALDASGNIYIAGQTYSSNLPLRNALQPRLAGGADGFLAEFTPAGTLVYGTFYGGALDDAANGIAVTPDGMASIAGATQSLDLPLSAPIQSRSGGGQDAFLRTVREPPT